MKSKIEKLVFAGDLIENELERIRIKINKIIDYLNSQDQELEEIICEGCGKVITSRFMQSYERDDGIYYYCLSCDPEKQDTPEEWEERFVKRFGYFSGEIDFIKDLLLEREREVLNSMREWVVEYHKDNWDIRDFDAEKAIGKIVDRELDKLNK